MYKEVCSECGKIVYRMYRLNKPICDKCKLTRYYKYEKSGYYEKFIERNIQIYIARQSGASYNELIERYGLSRMRLFRIIEKVGKDKSNGGYKIIVVKATSKA